MFYIMFAIVTLLILFSGIGAEQIPSDQEVLGGIKNIRIQVSKISPGAKGKGVERKYLRRNVALKLQ